MTQSYNNFPEDSMTKNKKRGLYKHREMPPEGYNPLKVKVSLPDFSHHHSI